MGGGFRAAAPLWLCDPGQVNCVPEPPLAALGYGHSLQLLRRDKPWARTPTVSARRRLVPARLFLRSLEQILGSSGLVGGSGLGEGVGCERVR